MKHWPGNKSFAFEEFECMKVLAWLSPVVTALAVDYAASWIAYLQDAGGWRKVLAFGLVMAGRAAYQWVMNNTGQKT